MMLLLAALLLTAPAPPADAADPAQNPVELGRVAWVRDLDAGFAQAKESSRPVFLLFQEIPGCQTCQDFGQGPLSQPLLVEALETEFVPVAIYNNIEGRDAEVLKRYDEPSWNNPVFRFFAPDGRELMERKDRLWKADEVAARMIAALEAAERQVPDYLRLAREEVSREPTEVATFSMHCYWEGEAQLGALPGVVSTESGWLGEKEVVRVTYRPSRVAKEKLVEAASAMACSLESAPSERRAKESDQLYYLQNAPYRLLPLTPLQAVRVNAALGTKGDPARWLTPGQRGLAAKLLRLKDRDPDFGAGLRRPESLEAWPVYEKKLRALLDAALTESASR